MYELYTIGHSDHGIEAFVSLLRQHSIGAIADVRSSPYSARFPQFGKEMLEQSLKEQGIRYVFLGQELGARRGERSCYVDGRADYDRIAEQGMFLKGLDRLRKGLERYRIALVCAERDPLECHRTILVCRRMKSFGVDIRHIRYDGEIETHADAELRLMKEEATPDTDLFLEREELLSKAYTSRGEKIAFREPATPVKPQAT